MQSVFKDSKLTSRITKALVIFLGVILLTAIVSIRSWYKPSIKLYEKSPVTVILQRDREVRDKILTDEAREKARSKAIQELKGKEILKIDESSFDRNLKKLKFLIQTIRKQISPLAEHPDPLNPRISLRVQDMIMDLSEEKFLLLRDAIYTLKDTDLQAILEELDKLVDLERRYFFEDIEKLREEKKREQAHIKALGKTFFEELLKVDYESIFTKSFEVQKKLLDLGLVHGLPQEKILSNIKVLYPQMPRTDLYFVQKILGRTLEANIRIDWIKVHAIEEEAMDSVEEMKSKLNAGMILAEKGKNVSKRNYFYLKELGMLHPRPDFKEILNNFYLISLFTLSIILLSAFTSFGKFTVQEVIMMFFVLLGVSAHTALVSIWGVNKLAMIPLATISILLTVFYAPMMAGILSTFFAFFLVKSFDMDFWQVLPLYFGSLYGIFLVRKAHQREDLTNAGTNIALAQVLIFALTIVIAVPNFKISSVLIIASLYLLSGISSGFISLATLPYLESSLGILSPFKLAELSNPNQVLLKFLKEKAPGTYQHSLNVAALAEQAAFDLGLNTELIRVGLLYHDVGKTYNPGYFIENTLGKPNPHTTLDDPKKSAEIILAHVPEGIKLAKKHNLPSLISDFIPMHQGKTITNFFYHKAVEKYGKTNVNPDDYRYPGPRPNSKETGIAMLADGTEAALKSLKDLDDETKAKEIIDKIIEARYQEGELKEADLSQDELKTISVSFLKVWKSQNHERIKYPEGERLKN
jgi:cyclic-di-AMP phosphodiesterase PgpH